MSTPHRADGSSAAAGPLGPPRWVIALELAHDRLLRAARGLESIAEPTFDLAPTGAALERALEAIYVVYDERGDRLVGAQSALAAIGGARAALGAAEEPVFESIRRWLDEATSAVDAAQEPLSRLPARPPPPPRPLHGSKDVPTLHEVARASLVPKLRVGPPPVPPDPPPPPLAPPQTLEELAATIAEVKRRAAERSQEFADKDAARAKERVAVQQEPETAPGFVARVDPAWTDDAFVASKVRELFEEVAMVGMQRTPLLGDPFRSCAFLERRLLCAMDALAGFGARGLAKIEPLVVDAPVKDATRAFGAAFVFGCIEGRDSLAAAERVLHFCGPLDDEVAKGWSDAMKLVPHPHLPIALRAMMQDPSEHVRAIALGILVHRHWASVDELVAALADPSPRVVALALPELAVLKHPHLDQAIEAAIAHADPALREAAWTAMALSSHTWTVNVLEKEIDGPLGARAVEHLGVLCESRDAERLFERAKATPTEPLIAALGWAGLGATMPFLIALLAGSAKKPVKIAAAYALDRITGAQLYEPFELDPETLVIPDLPEPEVGEAPPKGAPLAQVVSDPRDVPGDGAKDQMVRPSTSAAAWKAYWDERKGFYDAKTRYRRGHPYVPVVSLWEMTDGWTVTPAERRLLQRELVVRTGDWVAFDPHDWVAVQEEALRQWEPSARRAGGYPGGWERSRRR